MTSPMHACAVPVFKQMLTALRAMLSQASEHAAARFFHVTIAYAILRHNGVAIGKRDYMGAY